MEIQLSKGLAAIVDDEDYEYLVRVPWYADVGKWTAYAKTDRLPRRPRMHVAIMKPQGRLIVHHKDGNGLNNRRSNLEIMTQLEHSRLSSLRKTKRDSQYRGVCIHKCTGKYAAEITFNYKKMYLGLFDTEEEAAMAYNEASLRLFGDKAVLNEICSCLML
jgi:AP2 domain/HNH endonuclease